MRKQEMLMGGAIKFAPHVPHGAAEEIAYLLSHPEEAERRGRIGRIRMGPPGASRHIASGLLELFGVDCARSTAGITTSIGVEPVGE
jgi:hypothetical protein